MITGGNGEIGQAIIEKFKDGYQLIAPSRQEMDLENMHSVDNYLDNLRRAVDVFIHCAGFNEPKSISNVLIEDLNKTLNINAISFYKIVNSLVRNFKIKKNGYILAISSIYGLVSRRDRFSYSSAKHCLNGMIKTLAIDLGELNIKVNAISPGFVDTRLTRNNNSPEKIQSFKQRIPLGRLANTEDIAEVAYFMCSLGNRYITGQQIIIDGGYTIGGFER